MARVRADCGRRLLVDCGGLNLVQGTVPPGLASAYAVESYTVLGSCSCAARRSPASRCASGSPQFDADGGWLDVDAGLADLTAVTQALREGLARGACG